MLIINYLILRNMKKNKDILSELLDYLNISQSKLAENIGFDRYRITDIKRNKTGNFPADVAVGVVRRYPEIRYDWLTGDSDQMFCDGVANKKNMNPYYNAFTIQGGIATGFGDEKAMTPDGYMAVPGIKPSPEIQFFQVKGDSMVDPYNPSKSIPEGSWVAIRKNNTNEPEWGHIYAIMTLDGPIVKILMPSDKGEDYIRVESLNSEKYPPRNLHKTEIVGDMRKVVGVVKIQTL